MPSRHSQREGKDGRKLKISNRKINAVARTARDELRRGGWHG